MCSKQTPCEAQCPWAQPAWQPVVVQGSILRALKGPSTPPRVDATSPPQWARRCQPPSRSPAATSQQTPAPHQKRLRKTPHVRAGVAFVDMCTPPPGHCHADTAGHQQQQPPAQGLPTLPLRRRLSGSIERPDSPWQQHNNEQRPCLPKHPGPPTAHGVPMLPPRKKQRVEGVPSAPCSLALRDVSNKLTIARPCQVVFKSSQRDLPGGSSGPCIEVVAERCAVEGVPSNRRMSDEMDDAQSSRPPGAPARGVQLEGIHPTATMQPVLENALHALGRSMDDALRSIQGTSAEFEAGVRHALRVVAMGMARHVGMLQH